MTQWRGWDPVAFEDASDRRGADTMAELEQLALDPPIAPARVLPRIRSTNEATTSSIGGRPGRFG
jgi:hypothetical protein